MFIKSFWLSVFMTTLFLFDLKAQSPPELGNVNWLRNYDEAVKKAKVESKDIFILFQEVPGCSTCVNYGQQVLSHPLIVEALEQCFIPLAIFNNHKGHDQKILNKYEEPSWNNPVARVVHADGEDVYDRLSGNYSELGLVQYMHSVMNKTGTKIPLYLSLLHNELLAKSQRKKTAYYQMYCFWSGESHLGSLNGVVKTVPGFMNGAEVVQVDYDADIISLKSINKHAEKAKCKLVKDVNEFKADKDLQYYLKKSNFKYLALSDLQRTKINTALSKDKDPKLLLSPAQLNAYQSLDNNNSSLQSIYHLPIEEAWKLMTLEQN